MNLNFWKKCKHDYEFVRNIYGDEINNCGGYRSIWKCKKCGKYLYKYELYETYSLKNELKNITKDFYDNRFKEWQNEHSEQLNMLLKTMRDSAYQGYDSCEIVLTCNLETNDKSYYYKWITDKNLHCECELLNKKQKDLYEINNYLFKINWKN